MSTWRQGFQSATRRNTRDRLPRRTPGQVLSSEWLAGSAGDRQYGPESNAVHVSGDCATTLALQTTTVRDPNPGVTNSWNGAGRIQRRED